MGGITEVIGDGIRHILRMGSRTIGGILHVDRHTAVVHQEGNCLIVAVVDIVGHVVPIIVGALEVDRLRGITLWRIAV